MAHYTPAGGELVDTGEQNAGTTLGKPVAARYAQLFVLPAPNPERALEDALGAAEAAGWTVEEARRGALGGLVGQGSKLLSTGTARLALAVPRRDRPPGRRPPARPQDLARAPQFVEPASRRICSTARRSPSSSKRCAMQLPISCAGPSSSSEPAAALSA